MSLFAAPLSWQRLGRAAFVWGAPMLMGGLVFFVGCSPTTVARSGPERLYDEAWETVFHEFVDESFNGQDWQRWRNRYQGKLQTEEDAQVAIDTMLASLNDDYTRYLPPRAMKEQTLSIDSRLYGVGIQIATKAKKLVVIAPVEASPAARAGIQPHDIITAIDGEPTVGMAIEDAADRIRGPEGTPVTLTLQRGQAVRTVKLRRAEIKIKSVFSKVLQPKGVGYIHLSSFISETANREMQDALQKMKAEKAMILDLRGNYGGLLQNAVEIADMFLDRGAIVSMVDRQNKQRTLSAHPGQERDLPLVVLIDGGSASASEILSGALQDNRRAVLIGTRSFGKGLVQKVNTLQDGSGLNITISKYLTPNGTDINKKGIQPDIEVPVTPEDIETGRDPQLQAALDYLSRPAVKLSHRAH